LSLHIRNLSFSYPSSPVTLLQKISLEFHNGWSAIVGANGCGKSTLLKLITKELVGEGVIAGNDLVSYCPQSTEDAPLDFEKFMFTYTAKAFKIRDTLQIKDEWLGMWNALSHGERKRVQIGVALFSEPDVFVLDEPINHLDLKSKKIVLQTLEKFKGVGILVSHDRMLLNSLCTNTIILKNAHTILFKSDYSTAMHEYQQSLNHLASSQEQRDHEMKKLKNHIQTQQEKVLQSKQRLSKKGIDSKDSDAKAKINFAKLTSKDNNDSQAIKRATSKYKQIEKSSVQIEKIYKKGISFEANAPKKLFPLFVQKGEFSVHDQHKVMFDTLSIDAHEKIGIVGDNGAGKSSFIHYLLQTLELKDASFYIPQELTNEQSKNLLRDISALPQEEKGEIFTLITRLSSNPKTLLESSSPSPGETRKLLLAQALLAKPALIILDEPTNHMDLDSILALEDALREYEGALLLVSHDELFLEAITTKTWSFIQKDAGSYLIRD